MRSLRLTSLNKNMDTVITVLVRILEAIFIAGILGSSVVLILTLIEDAKSLMPGDKMSGEKKDSEPPRSGSGLVQTRLHGEPIA